MSVRGLLTDLALSALALLLGWLVEWLTGSTFAGGYVCGGLTLTFRAGSRMFPRDPSKCPHPRVHCDKCDTTWRPMKLSEVDRWNRHSR